MGGTYSTHMFSSAYLIGLARVFLYDIEGIIGEEQSDVRDAIRDLRFELAMIDRLDEGMIISMGPVQVEQTKIYRLREVAKATRTLLRKVLIDRAELKDKLRLYEELPTYEDVENANVYADLPPSYAQSQAEYARAAIEAVEGARALSPTPSLTLNDLLDEIEAGRINEDQYIEDNGRNPFTRGALQEIR